MPLSLTDSQLATVTDIAQALVPPHLGRQYPPSGIEGSGRVDFSPGQSEAESARSCSTPGKTGVRRDPWGDRRSLHSCFIQASFVDSLNLPEVKSSFILREATRERHAGSSW
jgi:hypothetical protein